MTLTGWIEDSILALCFVASIAALFVAVHSKVKLDAFLGAPALPVSAPALAPSPSPSVSGPTVEADPVPKLWADDVLAAEEREAGVETDPDPRGICDAWELQDEREFRQEHATRLQLVHRART